ncbi:hypothetical protein [Flammeovirga agarivorans]|uniref:Uncharacterized protein n=1 Tax=Flammeovirga agarivorans TaxID=2726742 RepID=A0A7X8SRC7_9BACT|nr:hypothetical protein [Flammeovirga agarivorans]NLR94945.1 hypothetical protein [Flammeovirga agarivorans]
MIEELLSSNLSRLSIAANLDVEQVTLRLKAVLENRKLVAKQLLNLTHNEEEQIKQLSEILKYHDVTICKLLGMKP